MVFHLLKWLFVCLFGVSVGGCWGLTMTLFHFKKYSARGRMGVVITLLILMIFLITRV